MRFIAYTVSSSALLTHALPPRPLFFSCYGRVVDLCDLVLSVLASMFAGKPVPTSHADLPWFTVTRWQDDPFACGSYSFMQVGLASGLVLPPSLLTRGLP